MKRIVILPLLFFFLFGGVAAREPDQENRLKLVWLIIDQLTLEELAAAHTPNIDYLQSMGAFSLLNPRNIGNLDPESTYLSINTGKESQGNQKSQNSRQLGDGAVNDRIRELVTLNSRTHYRAEPGLLGDLARENGIKIGILGNCDLEGEENRGIVSMAMDSTGYVPLARIDKSILKKSSQPWGFQTDFSKLEEFFLDFKKKAQAVIIETGDISRIEYYYRREKENSLLSDRNNEETIFSAKIKAVERIDDFIAFLLRNIDLEETQLGIISPGPPPGAVKNAYRMSWVLLAGRDIQHGWLSSTTTRRKGIMTIQDLLPVFLEGNGIRDLSGRYFPHIRLIPERVPVRWEELNKLNRELRLIYRLRTPFIKLFILLQIISIVTAIIKLIYRISNQPIIFLRFSEYLLIALLLVPVNCLLMGFLRIYSSGIFVFLFTVFLFLGELFLFCFIEDRLMRLIIISWLIVFLCFFDLWNDYQLLADTILGYSSVIGARYYGIGNEYMGFYLGAFLLAFTVSMEKLKGRVKIEIIYLIPLFLLIIYSIGGANLGANFGGMITALISILVSFYFLCNYRKTILILSAVLLFLLIIFADYSGITGSSSHIGRAVEHLINGDWLWLKDIVSRKLAVNLRLLRWTIWTRVLLAMMVYLFLLVKKPGPGLRLFFQEYPFLKAGIYGTLAGSAVTIFVNDSGVVAAATLLFYPVMSLLYLYDQSGIKKKKMLIIKTGEKER